MVEFESKRKPASVPQTAGQLEKDDEDELDEQPYTFETKRTFELLGEQESTLDRELNLARQFREEHLAMLTQFQSNVMQCAARILPIETEPPKPPMTAASKRHQFVEWKSKPQKNPSVASIQAKTKSSHADKNKPAKPEDRYTPAPPSPVKIPATEKEEATEENSPKENSPEEKKPEVKPKPKKKTVPGRDSQTVVKQRLEEELKSNKTTLFDRFLEAKRLDEEQKERERKEKEEQERLEKERAGRPILTLPEPKKEEDVQDKTEIEVEVIVEVVGEKPKEPSGSRSESPIVVSSQSEEREPDYIDLLCKSSSSSSSIVSGLIDGMDDGVVWAVEDEQESERKRSVVTFADEIVQTALPTNEVIDLTAYAEGVSDTEDVIQLLEKMEENTSSDEIPILLLDPVEELSEDLLSGVKGSLALDMLDDVSDDGDSSIEFSEAPESLSATSSDHAEHPTEFDNPYYMKSGEESEGVVSPIKSVDGSIHSGGDYSLPSTLRDEDERRQFLVPMDDDLEVNDDDTDATDDTAGRKAAEVVLKIMSTNPFEDLPIRGEVSTEASESVRHNDEADRQAPDNDVPLQFIEMKAVHDDSIDSMEQAESTISKKEASFQHPYGKPSNDRTPVAMTLKPRFRPADKLYSFTE